MQTMHNDEVNLEGKIKAEAYRLGFSLCGFTGPEKPSGFERYEKWISQKQHADMVYLESSRHLTMRQDPNRLVPGVKTIISLGWPYILQNMDDKSSNNEALIAGYTSDVDYHLSLPSKMDQLIHFIQNEIVFEIHAQTFTDNAPILEREIASRAGLGWIGKNSCLISSQCGSAFLLAEIAIDYPFKPDQPFAVDHCGTCRRCLDACPTACIQEDRTIDSARCISYLTIENKGSIPEDLRPLLGKWLFGCDVCQTICPWNQKLQQNKTQSCSHLWTRTDVEMILSISPQDFLKQFNHTALQRTKLKGLQRNALVWLGNNSIKESLFSIQDFILNNPGNELEDCARWTISKLGQDRLENWI